MENQFKKLRIIIFSAIVFIAGLALVFDNKLDNSGKAFLKNSDLNLTLKVTSIIPTGDHGYGAIFGKVVNSNKSENYSAIFKDQYVFCKIEHDKVLLVSDYFAFQRNDSVIVNSKLLKYKIYRNGKLVADNNLTITTDLFLYQHLEDKKYLNFDIGARFK